MTQPRGANSIGVEFLEEDAQDALEVAGRIAAFIETARRSIDIAIYDCRLSDGPATVIRRALTKRREAGVQVRLVYDAGDKPQSYAEIDERGLEPAPLTTHIRIEELGLPAECIRAISGLHALMHHLSLIHI